MEAFDRKPAEEVISSNLDFDNIMGSMGMNDLIDNLLDGEDLGDDDYDDEEDSKDMFEEMRKKAKR